MNVRRKKVGRLRAYPVNVAANGAQSTMQHHLKVVLMLEYLIIFGLVIWAIADLIVPIILVTVLIAALGAAIWRK